jgi:hypothetical protein
MRAPAGDDYEEGNLYPQRRWVAATARSSFTVVPRRAALKVAAPTVAKHRATFSVTATVTDPAAPSYTGADRRKSGTVGDVSRAHVRVQAFRGRTLEAALLAPVRKTSAAGVGTARVTLRLPAGTYRIVTTVVASDGSANDYYATATNTVTTHVR